MNKFLIFGKSISSIAIALEAKIDLAREKEGTSNSLQYGYLPLRVMQPPL